MSETSPAPILDIQQLEVSYGAVHVLRGISLSVMKGQVVCILGPNGAGKTTTLNTIIGVLKPKSGQIIFEGQDIASLRPHQRVARHIALIPEGRQLWPGMTVEDSQHRWPNAEKKPSRILPIRGLVTPMERIRSRLRITADTLTTSRMILTPKK